MYKISDALNLRLQSYLFRGRRLGEGLLLLLELRLFV